jgi:EAL domain-containing protein (putative c-di-GMP-specific phosphodiesterase class I)
MRVAVNLSARQFENTHLPDLVRQTLKNTGLAAEYLELEITESLAMQNAEHVLKMMQRLTEDGVALAMDDFGTGYSNLSYLKNYPLSVLKIDQIFVRQFLEDAGDEAIIIAILALAQSFRLSVIAEGVETESQASRLKALGCNYFQGYLFSKPLTAEQATDWLQQRQEHRDG